MLFRRRTRNQLRCRDTERDTHLLEVAVHVDNHGRAHTALVVDGVALLLPQLDVGWLRGQLRAAVYDAAQRSGEIAEQAERERVAL
jgi:hypothetical protein